MTNEELLNEYEFAVALCAVQADHSEPEVYEHTVKVMESIKLEILRRMK